MSLAWGQIYSPHGLLVSLNPPNGDFYPLLTEIGCAHHVMIKGGPHTVRRERQQCEDSLDIRPWYPHQTDYPRMPISVLYEVPASHVVPLWWPSSSSLLSVFLFL
jgi:hypothetical protein